MENNLKSNGSVREMLNASGKRSFLSGLFGRNSNAAGASTHKPRKIWIAAGVGVAVAGVWTLWGFTGGGGAPQFATAMISRGDLEVTITATGNLQPLNQVDIGTEVSGTVETVSVDYNDHVKKGQELARLITVQWQDQVRKSKAAFNSAKARRQQAEASQIEAAQNLKRLQELKVATEGRLPAQAELESAQAADRRARADLAVAEANVESAQADLATAETNLAKAIIISPIDGVVLSRVVEPGQTVAASLSAPTLFTLAEDLSKMELEVSVDEADIGQMDRGLAARFSVDAWPGREYPAEVTRVSLGSSIVDNVVSYSTLLSVENPDQTLRPGMTATATIVTESKQNVLLVPNAALRFTPPAELMPEPEAGEAGAFLRAPRGEGEPRSAGGAPGERPGNRGGERNSERSGMLAQLMPGPRRFGGPRNRNQPEGAPPLQNRGPRHVWILENGQLKPVRVRTGVSDGRHTEIVGGPLQEGAQVVTGIAGARG
ncbi:efflux RND transporter periplasmic adaptor subunit [Microbulbifer pacificus]|uniref:efflux RND transporter periplasmic adaptor subunit n=1 Tax=Microbulbifer pacificus TaxID=407164 RepID=UPI0018F89D36|nr:efflux RND transporter periplasmic adaptor subunit [Microbulbifer pacificus]